MNEQAIQDAYGLFTGTGYTGSYDEFVDLIYTNQQALEDAYGLFQQTGYEGGLDGFSTLMGVKKKTIRQSRSLRRKRLLRNLPQVRLHKAPRALELRVLL